MKWKAMEKAKKTRTYLELAGSSISCNGFYGIELSDIKDGVRLCAAGMHGHR